MLKKQLTLLFTLVLAFPLAMAVAAQEVPAKPKQGRVEGTVIRTSVEKSTLSVRGTGTSSSAIERTVLYDSSTRWVSQYHGAKQAKDIDRSQVKENDYVICTGTWEQNGAVLHATMISKRLSHSPNQ